MPVGIRIPDVTMDIPCLAYDTFTASNGTSLDAHTSDTSGPDSQTVTGRSWTENVVDFEIQSNKCVTKYAASNKQGHAVIDLGAADIVLKVI